MQVDEAIISYVVTNDALAEIQGVGISDVHFTEDHRPVWRYLLRTKREHDAVPSREVLKARFPDLDLPRVKQRDVAMLVRQIKQRRRYNEFISLLYQASACDDWELVDPAIQTLQADLNSLSVLDTGQSHLVDIFSNAGGKQMMREIRRRRNGVASGIPTGLTRFDMMTGGLQAQKMVCVVGRPGLGKSWLDLMFVASAVMAGRTVMLYPLEMTLFETSLRLYTIFSQKMFGMRRVLRNYDLSTGNVSMPKVRRFLGALEDQFKGQLYVADVAALADPYTNERIEAEVELHRPDMFWVDYLTLLKPPPGSQRSDDWAQVRQLSNGIKNTAMRRGTVGGCSAQVNREAIRGAHFLPRLEHIAYGDSIGQDADLVFSINRNSQGLWYSLVKNRGGPEIDKMCLTWDPNSGNLEERDPQPDYDAPGPSRRHAL